MKHSYLAAMILVFTTACGNDQKQAEQGSVSAINNTTTSSDADGDIHTFAGFVANAFEVTVDGLTYQDLEDFYTQEMDRLPQKVQGAGYDPSYKVKLEAEIGFTDLWQGMQVFILSTGQQGYQSQTTVGSNGSFSADLPDAALNDTYKIRANKRIRVIISNGQDQNSLCYNFSAREKSVPFDETSKPIILDSFETSLTKYDCPTTTSNTGLDIPGTAVIKLKPGMSKPQVLSVLGSVGLTIQDTQTWCWGGSQAADELVCSSASWSACDCSVAFDAEGHLIAVDNIRSQWLDVLSW